MQLRSAYVLRKNRVIPYKPFEQKRSEAQTHCSGQANAEKLCVTCVGVDPAHVALLRGTCGYSDLRNCVPTGRAKVGSSKRSIRQPDSGGDNDRPGACGKVDSKMKGVRQRLEKLQTEATHVGGIIQRSLVSMAESCP
jgi:hypothetical protein